jgi:hypothetical protein
MTLNAMSLNISWSRNWIVVIDRIALFLVEDDFEIAHFGGLDWNRGALPNHPNDPDHHDKPANETGREAKR